MNDMRASISERLSFKAMDAKKARHHQDLKIALFEKTTPRKKVVQTIRELLKVISKESTAAQNYHVKFGKTDAGFEEHLTFVRLPGPMDEQSEADAESCHHELLAHAYLLHAEAERLHTLLLIPKNGVPENQIAMFTQMTEAFLAETQKFLRALIEHKEKDNPFLSEKPIEQYNQFVDCVHRFDQAAIKNIYSQYLNTGGDDLRDYIEERSHYRISYTQSPVMQTYSPRGASSQPHTFREYPVPFSSYAALCAQGSRFPRSQNHVDCIFAQVDEATQNIHAVYTNAQPQAHETHDIDAIATAELLFALNADMYLDAEGNPTPLIIEGSNVHLLKRVFELCRIHKILYEIPTDGLARAAYEAVQAMPEAALQSGVRLKNVTEGNEVVFQTLSRTQPSSSLRSKV